jgi:hypothetical protein
MALAALLKKPSASTVASSFGASSRVNEASELGPCLGHRSAGVAVERQRTGELTQINDVCNRGIGQGAKTMAMVAMVAVVAVVAMVVAMAIIIIATTKQVAEQVTHAVEKAVGVNGRVIDRGVGPAQ